MVKNASTKGRNIGKGASIYRAFARGCDQEFDDLHAFHAPSECVPLVQRSQLRRFRVVRRHIKSVTGLRFNAFIKEAERRTSGRWIYFNMPSIP